MAAGSRGVIIVMDFQGQIQHAIDFTAHSWHWRADLSGTDYRLLAQAWAFGFSYALETCARLAERTHLALARRT